MGKGNLNNFIGVSLNCFHLNICYYLAADPGNSMPEPETMTVVPDVSEVNEAGSKCEVPSLLDTVFCGYSNVQVEKTTCAD